MHKFLILALAVIAAAMPIELSDVETEVKDILNEAEDLPSGLPPVHDILADVESSLPDGELLDTSNPSVQDLLLDIDSLLPTTNELEIPSTTKVAHKRGLITNIESEGSDLLNSQDIVPLEDTLSEFKSSSSASWSAWPSPTAKPSPSGKPSGDKPKGTNYLATFDDLTPVVGEVAVQEVGPYDGLDYNGIDLVTLGVEGTIVTGIVPKSSPNAGAYGLTTGLLDGLPNITTKYEGTVTESFDFHNFWFGCVKGTVESVASEPLSCNVTVIGYKKEHLVASETIIFTFNTLVDGVTKNMTQAKLGWAFSGIDTATFETSYDVTNLIGATLIDSLSYTVYNKKDSKGGEKQ